MKIANDKRRAAQIVQPKDLNLQMMFAECNHLYFNDELKEIPIEFEHNDVNYGEFYYDITPKGIDNCHIKIADNHERTKKEYLFEYSIESNTLIIKIQILLLKSGAQAQ